MVKPTKGEQEDGSCAGQALHVWRGAWEGRRWSFPSPPRDTEALACVKMWIQVTTSLEHVEEKMYDFEANKVIGRKIVQLN